MTAVVPLLQDYTIKKTEFFVRVLTFSDLDVQLSPSEITCLSASQHHMYLNF